MLITKDDAMTSSRQPTLGVHLLETITRGMYSEPFHCVREYIQNSFDSIRKARRTGLLTPDEGVVEIKINSIESSLVIRDNGTGLSPEAASVYLLDLGNSDKATSNEGADQNAGFRGIGRMAGISYCNKLRFETSDGDGRKCTVEFNARGIYQLTERGQKPATIVEAIEKNSTIEEEKVSDQSHYLQVTMEGLPADIKFLKEQELGDYLAMNAPVAFDPTQWSFSEKIKDIARACDCVSALDVVKILILDNEGSVQRDIRRPFKDTFQSSDARGNNQRSVNVTDVKGLPLDGDIESGWWGWLAIHERQGALADVPFFGIRLRMHNIAVGDEKIIRKLFRSQFLAAWCFGEIYITDPSLMLNAQRNNFKESKSWSRLQNRFRDQAVLLEKDIRGESSQRSSSVKTLTSRAQKQIQDAQMSIDEGFISWEERQATLEKLGREKLKLEKAAKQKKRSDTERAQIELKRQELETTISQVNDVCRTRTNEVWAHLNKQSRRVLRTIFEVLNNELEEKDFTNVQEKIQAALVPGKGPKKAA